MEEKVKSSYIDHKYIYNLHHRVLNKPDIPRKSKDSIVVYSNLNYPVYVYITPPSPAPSHNPNRFYLHALPDQPNPFIAPYSSNTSSTRGVRFRFTGVAVDICGADDEVVVAVAAGGWPGTCSGLAEVPEEAALLDFFLDFFFSYIIH